MVLGAENAGATFSGKKGKIPHSVLWAFKDKSHFFWDTLYVPHTSYVTNHISLIRTGAYSGGGENLTFNGAYCNSGSGLDVDTGVFTCPIGNTWIS